ncbi:MAG: SprB repeat-containing protein, partial [Bacteroidia bacterium]|nr:SprB repeat-containing protein [Bacteroidia bacterium]
MKTIVLALMLISGSAAAQTPLTATATNVNAVPCAGINVGAVTIQAFGGTPPYRYSRDGGVIYVPNGTFTGLPAGAHMFIVRDAAGARVNVPVVIPSAPPLLTVVEIEPISACGADDGEILVFAQGGNPPYEYSLNFGPFGAQNHFTNLAPGQYSIKVRDAAGCFATHNVNLFYPTLLNPTVSFTHPTGCNAADGEITVSPPTTGTPPYQYALNWGPWQAGNTFAGLASGLHQVRVRDAEGCELRQNVRLDYFSNLTASITPTNLPACPGMGGGSVQIAVSGGTPPYQLWFNNVNYPGATAVSVSNLTAGQTYWGNVTDAAGCQHSFNFYMPAAPNTLNLENEVVQPGCFQNDGQIRVTASGGVPPYTFAFSNGVTLNTNPAVLSGLAAGQYSVVVTDAQGCSRNENFV